jgi:hypothetical protein
MKTILFGRMQACGRILVTVAGAALLAGCAGGTPPETELALARSAMDEATRDGAAERAPQQFILAREKLAQAEAASRDEEYTDARRLAEQAEVDARLASAMSRTAAAETVLTLVQEGDTTLEEIQREQPDLYETPEAGLP